jgi:hypothetical protein
MAVLDTVLPEGRLVDRAWLQEHGIDRSAVDYYLRSGKLKRVTQGVYRKPGPPLKWQNLVYSLSLLGYRVHVGHLSALAFHGYQHYIELEGKPDVRLYSDKNLPGWVNGIDVASNLVEMKRSPFVDFEIGIEDTPFGTWDWPIRYATAERGFMEAASTVSSAEEIRRVKLMMDGAANLRPSLLQLLLQMCRQVKAKRLFLWLARECEHGWYRHLDQSKIGLGSGKRQIVEGGFLDEEYMITVPGKNDDKPTKPLF